LYEKSYQQNGAAYIPGCRLPVVHIRLPRVIKPDRFDLKYSLTVKIVIMKKTFIAVSCFMMIAVSALASTPNEKVLKVFQATFASPQDVRWTEQENFYYVSFIQSGIRSRVKYDAEGNFISSLRYYTEQHLPLNVISGLKKRYADKKIFGITEITTDEEVVYHVKLEDAKRWYTVKISGNGRILSSEKFWKA
jgi:hypothetical protein